MPGRSDGTLHVKIQMISISKIDEFLFDFGIGHAMRFDVIYGKVWWNLNLEVDIQRCWREPDMRGGLLNRLMVRL